MSKNTLENKVIAMSNILAEKSTYFTTVQQKLFYVSIASLRNGVNIHDEVEINKHELLEFLGMENDTKRYDRLKKELDQLQKNSFISFKDKNGYSSGFIIYNVRMTRNNVYIRINNYYLPLLQNLSDNFVRFLNDDLIGLKSKYPMMLYQNLMKDKWKISCIDFMGIDYSTKQLKDMFGLPKEAYMATSGNFNRTLFEKKTINKAVEELNNKCKCIKNLKYEKIKKNGRVQYYRFSFDYTDPQSVADDCNERKGKSIIDSMQKESDEFSDEIKNLKWWK
jgi:hypothetical protein